MKRIVFRFWLLNILISIALFVAYRIEIAQTDGADGNFLESVVQILDVFLNVIYSSVYLIAIVFCSLTLFLNLINRIRNNFYLSLLTFIAIPLVCIIFITFTILTNNFLQYSDVTVFRNLLTFSIIYLFLTTLEFLLFRKRINKLQSNDFSSKAKIPTT